MHFEHFEATPHTTWGRGSIAACSEGSEKGTEDGVIAAAGACAQVRDRATLYLAELDGHAGGPEAIDVQWSIPAKNLESSLRAYLDNGTDAPFDLVPARQTRVCTDSCPARSHPHLLTVKPHLLSLPAYAHRSPGPEHHAPPAMLWAARHPWHGWAVHDFRGG